MVGLALGIALAKGGLEVVVADPVPQAEALAAAFDGRVSALAFASVRMFRRLGIWERLEKQAQPIDDILVTDAKLGGAPSPFSLHFDHRELGAPLGYIAENRHIRQALFAACAELPNLTVVAPAAVTSLDVDANGVNATLGSGQTIRARLAVAADGRQSQLREAMGIGMVSWSYPQWGIVATVHHALAHNGVAYEHFLPSGPFAILPLTGNRSSLVWTERQDIAPGMMKLAKPDFDAEIARRFGAHLGEVHSEELRWSYPLRFHLARSYVKPRFALAGDAAHGIHPIAGQGLNLGLKDAARAGRRGAGGRLARPRSWRSRRSHALRALAAVRFLHLGHGDGRAEPAVLQRRSRRCAWRATSAWGSSTVSGRYGASSCARPAAMWGSCRT